MLNAIQSGADSVPLDDGAAISVADLLVAFGMEPHVPELGDEERVENTQASFTPGPLLELLQSLIERGVINPTVLNYSLFGPEEILFLLDGLADISLLNWSLEGASSVTEGDTTIYTVSYTGVTLAPGQTVTISVATGGGFDSTPDDATPGSDYTALGTVLTFTGGGPTAQTIAVSTIDDTVVEGSEDFIVTLADPTAGTLVTSQANTVIEDDGDSSLLNWSIDGSSEVSEGGTAGYTVS
ncbi:MAG: Calx-beta domain-containing protein, partial [Dongiaceae bacterium]